MMKMISLVPFFSSAFMVNSLLFTCYKDKFFEAVKYFGTFLGFYML